MRLASLRRAQPQLTRLTCPAMLRQSDAAADEAARLLHSSSLGEQVAARKVRYVTHALIHRVFYHDVTRGRAREWAAFELPETFCQQDVVIGARRESMQLAF